MFIRQSVILLVTLGLCAPANADNAQTFTGKVLPFEIITAIRNYGYAEGMRPSQVAISVKGGSQADWLATAAWVAEKSIVSDVTFATVEIYVPTPWGDKPPTQTKLLAKAYYGGPDPSKSPWPDDPFSLFAQGHAPTLADVEIDLLSDKLLSEASPNADPDKASDAASARAVKMIRKKYHLPSGWKPDEHLGAEDLNSVNVKRDQVVISQSSDAEASLAALNRCLSKETTAMFRGCPDRSEEYRFNP